MNNVLPFPRSRCYSDKGVVTMSDTTASHLEGTIYQVQDTVRNTGRIVTLMIVKNDTGAAITVSRRGFKFSTTDPLDFTRRIAGLVNSAGMLGVLIDDAYPVGYSIPDDDLFYVIIGGPGTGVTESTGVNLAALDPVAFDASGYINGTKAENNQFVVGVIDAACTTKGANVTVHVQGLIMPETSG